MPVKLKTIYDSETDIPEGFADLYAERSGHFELVGVEGVKTQADIDRVNAALVKERKDHKDVKDKLQAFGDVDPTTLPALQEELAEAKARLETLTADGKVNEAAVQSQIDAAIARAVGPVNRDKESLSRQLDVAKKAVSEKETEIANLQSEQQNERIRNALRDAAIEAKVRPTAIDDAVLVGERMFEFVDGKLVTKNADGITPGLNPKEWAKDMMEKRPHWWPDSVGGGSSGGKGGGFSAKDNPWAEGNWNVTEQGRLYKENPEKAAALAARVGSKIGAVRPTKAA